MTLLDFQVTQSSLKLSRLAAGTMVVMKDASVRVIPCRPRLDRRSDECTKDSLYAYSLIAMVLRKRPRSMSDSLIVLSYDAEATSFLLGEKATVVTGYV
jgi:hypothetical protein